MLTTMISDGDLGNHRLALTTVNSAIHNKMDLVFPYLDQLLPAVVADTNIKPELIREVQMGPFKHKVDDGLELRKVRCLPQNWRLSKHMRLTCFAECLRNALCVS